MTPPSSSFTTIGVIKRHCIWQTVSEIRIGIESKALNRIENEIGIKTKDRVVFASSFIIPTRGDTNECRVLRRVATPTVSPDPRIRRGQQSQQFISHAEI
ncbi:hypothetical protein EVAR_48815_1 [Eumeta japonica]|uniref:Uncharacterized protein n=1 Tax=Eumeta variegata TaxID=151549 RepID=A0A4C1Y4J4_EUMVA|nr:hypothetical protein EVAR_48815_1 [Eumeta japonica]